MNCLIRVDVGARIGTGHAMRCLALAQAWHDAGGKAIFAMATSSQALDRRLEPEGVEVVRLCVPELGGADDAVSTVDLARRYDAAWVVVDGYHFGAEYQRLIKHAGQRLLVFDDLGHSDHYYADLVINQNLHANEILYRQRELSTQLLLGANYALLRREFLQWRDWTRPIAEVARKVLVTLGGADPDNATLTVIRALEHVAIGGLDIAVVVGGSNPHGATLEEVARDSRCSLRLMHQVTDMPRLMADRDIAISSGGTTAWELAFMGLPTLMGTIVKTEEPLLTSVTKTGAFVGLGAFASLPAAKLTEDFMNLAHNQAERARMSHCGRRLIPGLGPQLLLQKMLAASGPVCPAGADAGASCPHWSP